MCRKESWEIINGERIKVGERNKVGIEKSGDGIKVGDRNKVGIESMWGWKQSELDGINVGERHILGDRIKV